MCVRISAQNRPERPESGEISENSLIISLYSGNVLVRYDASELDERMNQQLEEVLEQVRALPDERQQEVAQVLLAFLDKQNPDLYLSPEQIAEIECCAADDGPYASDEEVRSVFARLKK